MITDEQRQLLRDSGKTPFGKAILALLDEEEGKLEATLRNENMPLDTIRGAQKAVRFLNSIRIAIGQEKPAEKNLNQYT